jgi:hypothetical protein
MFVKKKKKRKKKKNIDNEYDNEIKAIEALQTAKKNKYSEKN